MTAQFRTSSMSGDTRCMLEMECELETTGVCGNIVNSFLVQQRGFDKIITWWQKECIQKHEEVFLLAFQSVAAVVFKFELWCYNCNPSTAHKYHTAI